MNKAILLSSEKLAITLQRLTHQLIEHHDDFRNSALIGLQPRGVMLSQAIYKQLCLKFPDKKILYGELDATFYRDDFRSHKGVLLPSAEMMNFSVEGKRVILVDDVLFTGRTIRAGLDKLLDYGRPSQIELMVLVDRRYSREVPIKASYVGVSVDSRSSDRVEVSWEENKCSVHLVKGKE